MAENAEQHSLQISSPQLESELDDTGKDKGVRKVQSQAVVHNGVNQSTLEKQSIKTEPKKQDTEIS